MLEVGIIFAFWTFLAVLTFGNRMQDPRLSEVEVGFMVRTALGIFQEYYLWALLTPLVFWGSRRFSIERSNWAWRVLLHLAMGLVIAVAVDVCSHYLRHHVIVGVRGRQPTFDPLFVVTRLWFLDELITYFAVLAAGMARDYFLRYRARLEETTLLRAEAVRLEAELSEARLQALRMQVNPHFLFNTLHAVSSLVERDPQGVRRMIARLSELLRYTLERSNTQEVAMRQELAFLRGYLEIQRIRFQGHLEVAETIDPEVLDALVPSLILQPIVENAVKHGVSKTEGVGRIEIVARREGELLHLVVTDNGPGFDGAGPPSFDRGVGLRNTRARLEGLYGTAQELAFRPLPGGGLAAHITLPYHTGADLRAAAVVLAE